MMEIVLVEMGELFLYSDAQVIAIESKVDSSVTSSLVLSLMIVGAIQKFSPQK